MDKNKLIKLRQQLSEIMDQIADQSEDSPDLEYAVAYIDGAMDVLREVIDSHA